MSVPSPADGTYVVEVIVAGQVYTSQISYQK